MLRLVVGVLYCVCMGVLLMQIALLCGRPIWDHDWPRWPDQTDWLCGGYLTGMWHLRKQDRMRA